MNVTEKHADGLSRTFEVVIAKTELAQKLEAKIEEIRPQVRLKGFRPGKVPSSHIRKMFGRSMMEEIIEDSMRETSKKALDDQSLRLASFPDIKPLNDAEAVAKGEADLAYEMQVELMPDFAPTDVKAIALERPVCAVGDEEIAAALAEVAKDQKVYRPRDAGAAAQDGDMLKIDFVGRINGEPFEGGSADDVELVLGAGRFIQGFETELLGVTAGEDRTFEITFPADYPAANLAGRLAEFEVTVNEVREPHEAKEDDELAKQVGFEDLDGLKEALRKNLESDFARQSRTRVKRRLLDKLDAEHSFDLPARMVNAEFDVIWRQVQADMEKGEVAEEDKDKTEDQLREEYRTIAERRVRLGLVLAEIGREANIVVGEEEMARAINMEARRFPGREREVARYFSENEQARAQLRAPIYEEKVVDYILERATITDADVSRDDLFAEEELV